MDASAAASALTLRGEELKLSHPNVSHADPFCALLAEDLVMDGGPDRGNPNRRADDLGNVVSEPRAAAKAHQDGDPNLGSKSPVAERASGKQTEAWNEAPGLAKNLELLGVSPQQFYALLDALLPRGWDSETGIALGNDESRWRLRELGLLASATAMSLVLGRVARTNASQARPLQQAAKPTLCRNRCGRLANASDVTCCHTCHKGHHTAQCLDRHLSSQDWESHAMERCSSVHDDQEPAFHTNSHEKRSAATSEVQLRGGFGREPRIERTRQRRRIGPYSDGGICSTSAASSDGAGVFYCQSCGGPHDESPLDRDECWECFFH